MPISVGDRIPEASLKQVDTDGAKDVSTNDFFAGRKVVLFGVPGAFTPTCSNNHLPGFVENRDAIGAKGIDDVAVISVNDHFVMKAWAGFTGAEDKITFLSDGNGDVTRALGLDIDLSKGGLGARSKRYSMIVDNGVVTAVNVEENPGEAVTSGAARILEQL
ncbi:peroxiredoxin [Nitratireductor indicus]|uniref:Glutathione-dependent peroxiredoxin n=1 Tax=Nitratireductor indicus C115 TaxID=1231190 RepID=K2N1G8_9HYPH|nr:peroxiredoxin [Nitratireductor indicus]EKF41333.1 redoxin [Nitratireductor indicus C115]MDS1138512.1 peroxiredoxin [Nitratireductor indicus]SFQ72750.1 Peroxiredoxin [Nitratireductor indicus]